MKTALNLITLLLTSALSAGELPPETAAKYLKVIASTAGNKVSCRDAALKAALEGAGIKVDGDAKVIWATNPLEIKSNKGKLVVVGRRDMLAAGGCIAILEEGGKTKIYLNQPAILASGVALSDMIYKVGEK
ncbi:MAG: hypothetical protein LWX11_06530 [Firmicutes bacterium]|nr:hypothetical protein [Bacillota bacterium]